VSATKICSKCVMDSSVDDIRFDDSGICNYCRLNDRLLADYPKSSEGLQRFEKLIATIKVEGKGRKYDCVVGISGGVDSCYLLVLARKHGLRPLAVNVDNGWNSHIAVNNIKHVLEVLGVDLRTYVIDWEEVRSVHTAFLRASLPWPDGTTDEAITAALFKIAAEEKIRYVLIGHDFTTEGKQPLNWTYTDGKMIKAICHSNAVKLRSFPVQSMLGLAYYAFFKRIKNVRPYWYIPYSKTEAKSLLESEYGWVDYGGHHHENLFTKFVISWWMPKKFGMDKRKVTYSALIRKGEMTRQDALQKLLEPPYDPVQMENDRKYVLQKLGISPEEFTELIESANKRFSDYPSYYPIYLRLKSLVRYTLSHLLPYKPMFSYDL
jgi:N-acetyl sugar amidotransferase